jgi:hypothetical protein
LDADQFERNLHVPPLNQQCAALFAHGQKLGRDEGAEITMFVTPLAHVPSKSVTNPSGRRKYQRVVLLHTLPDEVNIANHKPREEP